MKALLILVFWCLWFLCFSTRTIISPLLPVIEEELGITHTLSGSLFSLMAVGYTLTLLLSGWLSPRLGYKRSIIGGFFILSGALFSLQYAQSFFQLALACFVIGLGAGVYLPSAIPILTEIVTRKNWGKAIAFHDTAASFSILFIPLYVAFSLRYFPWRLLFVILGGGCIAALLLFAFLSPDTRAGKREKGGILFLVRHKAFWIMAILWIFAAAANLGLYNFIPLFLVMEKGMELETANTVFGFSRVGGFFVALAAGFIADRFGVRRVLFLSLLVTGFSSVALALVQGFYPVVVFLTLQATFCTAFFPIGITAISRLTSLGDRSAFTGMTVAMGVVFGLGVAPVVLGAIADEWNFRVGILMLGVLVTVSGFLLRFLHGIEARGE